MARPTVFGKEIVVDNDNKVIGINLGYNFYAEHEGDTGIIVNNMNKKLYMQLSMMQAAGGIRYRKQIKQLTKQIKNNEALMGKWSLTPFKGYVFAPTTNSMLKMIVINNSEIKKKYNNFMLQDGRYYLLVIGDGLTPEYWEKRFGTKKTVSEADLFDMTDYQSTFCGNKPYILNIKSASKTVRVAHNDCFAAAWALGNSYSNYLMIAISEDKKSYLEDIQKALKNGDLACVTQDRKIFSDRGCCLIDLDAAYRPRA